MGAIMRALAEQAAAIAADPTAGLDLTRRSPDQRHTCGCLSCQPPDPSRFKDA